MLANLPGLRPAISGGVRCIASCGGKERGPDRGGGRLRGRLWYSLAPEDGCGIQRDGGAPGVRIHLWGDPRVSEKIKPRLLRGGPPEMFLLADLPVWLLVAADKLATFDAALDQPAPGGTGTWRDCFIPGTLDQYTADGHVYGVPSAFGAWACWYDAKLFREHGWTPPATWSEFEALCAEMQAAGIAPLAFQGKYPIYAWWTFIPMVQRCGGLAAVNRINALAPGAFSHPDVVHAATLLQRMSTQYFEKGALAMTHTESQLQFVNNKAAMIFCGLWLYNEMKQNTPPDFEMRCFNLPAVDGGKAIRACSAARAGSTSLCLRMRGTPRISLTSCAFWSRRRMHRTWAAQLA
ncbi:MAG: extracellular solute-binding protein [Candidatus Competibacteraceae bacterium]|nr:extracellular solute-binding protein [Candidatus Competibacteraceae bacterium]